MHPIIHSSFIMITSFYRALNLRNLMSLMSQISCMMSQVSLWVSQILTLESQVLVLKSQLWCKVTAIKPIPFQPLLVFLSFLGMSQNSRYSEPTWQLAPNVGPARRNTIIQWNSNIPRRTTTEWLFINLMELLDQQRVFQHWLATLIDCQTKIFCWPSQTVPS